MNNEHLRKFDYLYFIMIIIMIIIMMGLSVYHNNQMNKIRILEEKTILYLDIELCERIKYLESISIEFQETKKILKPCNAYDKLELKRLINE